MFFPLAPKRGAKIAPCKDSAPADSESGIRLSRNFGNSAVNLFRLVRRRGKLQTHALVGLQCKRRKRRGNRGDHRRLHAVGVFGGGRAQKTAARRKVGKQAAGGNHRPRRHRLRLWRRHSRRKHMPEGFGRLAAGDGKFRHRRQTRQRLAAKAESLHRRKILLAFYLAGGVPHQRRRQILADNAAAVVLHLQQVGSAARQSHCQTCRARVQRIFHQLFKRRRRTLNHFAGRHLSGHRRRKNFNSSRRHRPPLRSAADIAAARWQWPPPFCAETPGREVCAPRSDC